MPLVDPFKQYFVYNPEAFAYGRAFW